MQTTLGNTARVPPFIGVDLTDRYANAARQIDVCGLSPVDGGGFQAMFWTWKWDAPRVPLNIEDVLHEIRNARATMIDGPQALCLPGHRMRECERLCGAAGKTPDMLPQPGRAYMGYVLASLELFTALHGAGVNIGPHPETGRVGEVYPGGIWRRLTMHKLPGKRSEAGRQARKQLLTDAALIQWPNEDVPTDDQNDACVAAVMAAAACGQVPGLTTHGIGTPLHSMDDTLREGELVMPHSLDDDTRRRISSGLQNLPPLPGSRTRNQLTLDTAVLDRANRLLVWLAALASHADPRLCTYKDAWRYMFPEDEGKAWSQAYLPGITAHAMATTPTYVPGLGFLRLDSFIVADATWRPGLGHWEEAEYGEDDWDRVLGCGDRLETYPAVE